MAADYKTLLGLVREFVDRTVGLSYCWGCGRTWVPGIDNTVTIEHIDGCLIARARASIEPSQPKNDPAIMHTHQSDACCSKPLMKAMRDGELDTKAQWACPRCDTEWIMQVVGGTHHWTPVPAFVSFRR